MESSQLSITVHVGDRTYPMKVKAEEEEDIRKAAKMVNDKIKELESKYAATDKQDYLAMAALMFAIKNLNRESNAVALDAEATDKLLKLDDLLTDRLKGKQDTDS